MWIVSRRRHEDELAAARAETNRQRERAEKAEANAKTWRSAQQTAARQFAESDAANKRLTGRNTVLADRLAAAQVASGFDAAQAKRTADRLARLQKAVARARAEAAEAPARARLAVSQELHRAKRAHAALDEQCRTLQASNEARVRELHDLRNGAAS